MLGMASPWWGGRAVSIGRPRCWVGSGGGRHPQPNACYHTTTQSAHRHMILLLTRTTWISFIGLQRFASHCASFNKTFGLEAPDQHVRFPGRVSHHFRLSGRGSPHLARRPISVQHGSKLCLVELGQLLAPAERAHRLRDAAKEPFHQKLVCHMLPPSSRRAAIGVHGAPAAH